MLNSPFYVRVLRQTICWRNHLGFRVRWKSYKCNDRKYTRNEDCLQEHLFKHFHSGKHAGFLENVEIMLIHKNDSQNPKKKEEYWRRTLIIYAPFGFNVEHSVWACVTTFGHYLLMPHLVLDAFFVATGKSFKWLTFTY